MSIPIPHRQAIQQDLAAIGIKARSSLLPRRGDRGRGAGTDGVSGHGLAYRLPDPADLRGNPQCAGTRGRLELGKYQQDIDARAAKADSMVKPEQAGRGSPSGDRSSATS